MTAKVYLVGAGPGDYRLITLKAIECLKKADAVVYDRLADDRILRWAKSDAEMVYVGKASANHTMKQGDINQLLADKAKEGKCVVRLKGGDPFLFGRGGEELELLAQNGIPFEVVPGITSAISVPAYNGIPVTHRDFCSSLHIITGHKRQGKEYDIDFEALVRTKGTLVFLMGIESMESLCRGLIDAGMDPDMPAAVLQEGTTARQRRVTATVSTLKEASDAAGIKAPAIITVGKVCTLADEFAWYEELPLAGLRVVVTRPKELISSMSERLRRKGAEVIEMPAIRTEAIEPNAALEEALAQTWDWIIFTSPTGVRIFFERYLKDRDVRGLAGTRIAVIGTGSEKALKKYGLRPDFVPSVYDGETLGRELAAILPEGARVLIPRAAIGNRQLTDELSRCPKIVLADIAAYDTFYETEAYGEGALFDAKAWFEDGKVDAAVFTSASTVKGFAGAVPGLDFTKVKAVCIGKQTKAAADALGMRTWMSEKATMDSVCERVEELADELKGSARC
mgnify:CR=1 FL=1